MELDYSKLDLLCLANDLYKPTSLCDIGGIWGVDGGYGVYAKTVLGIENVRIVDSHWTDTAKQCCKDSGVKIVDSFIDTYLNEDKLGIIDCVCLFHFLLHQVSPDWREILRQLSCSVKIVLINNPQWINGKAGFRLTELNSNKYFSLVPHSENEENYKDLYTAPLEIDALHRKPRRDLHHFWQWAITNNDLISWMNSLGYDLKYIRPGSVWSHNKHFQDYGFIFYNTKM
jgi:hypothetical protein